jgi:membrane-bound metal-dependent hydrolase YbcI (DUF457 family)
VAGVWTSRRAVPASLAALSVALGIVGAMLMAFNSDNRGANITFGILAGLVCAGLVWIGFALGRISRRSVRPA